MGEEQKAGDNRRDAEQERPKDQEQPKDRSHKDEEPKKSSRRDRSRSRSRDRRRSSRRDSRRDRSRSRSRDRRRRRSRSRSRSPPRKKKSSNWDSGAGGTAMSVQQQQAQLAMMQQMMTANQGQGGKKTRELYVGNLAIGMISEQMIREFFNTAMAGLAPEAAMQPAVVNVWMASDMKYSFVEFRTPELATTAMNLDKVELCGRPLHVGRPSGYVPPMEGGAGGMPGMMPGVPFIPGIPGMGAAMMGMAGGPASTKVLILENMLSVEELATDEYDDIVADIKEECGSFGTVEDVHVPKPSTDGSDVPGVGKAYIKFADAASSQKANASLMGRTFDGKKVLCAYLSEEKFEKREF